MHAGREEGHAVCGECVSKFNSLFLAFSKDERERVGSKGIRKIRWMVFISRTGDGVRARHGRRETQGQRRS